MASKYAGTRLRRVQKVERAGARQGGVAKYVDQIKRLIRSKVAAAKKRRAKS